MKLELCSIKMKKKKKDREARGKKKILRLPAGVINPKCFIKNLIAFWF